MDGHLTMALCICHRHRNSPAGILSGDVGVEMAVDGVSVGVQHHGCGDTHLGAYPAVSCSDMALEGAADRLLQQGWGCGYA